MDIREFAKSVKTGVEKEVDLQKLRYQISCKKREIEALFADAGRTAAGAVAEGGDLYEALKAPLAAVSDAQSELAALEKELSRLLGRKCCPACGTWLEKDERFCHSCGKKMPQDEKEDA